MDLPSNGLSPKAQMAVGFLALGVGCTALFSLTGVDAGSRLAPALALAAVTFLVAGTLAVGTSVPHRNA